jgi:hypothetical protein
LDSQNPSVENSPIRSQANLRKKSHFYHKNGKNYNYGNYFNEKKNGNITKKNDISVGQISHSIILSKKLDM